MTQGLICFQLKKRFNKIVLKNHQSQILIVFVSLSLGFDWNGNVRRRRHAILRLLANSQSRHIISFFSSSNNQSEFLQRYQQIFSDRFQFTSLFLYLCQLTFKRKNKFLKFFVCIFAACGYRETKRNFSRLIIIS